MGLRMTIPTSSNLDGRGIYDIFRQDYKILQDLQDCCFIRVPEAEADAKDGGHSLQSLVEVSQFSRAEREWQADQS